MTTSPPPEDVTGAGRALPTGHAPARFLRPLSRSLLRTGLRDLTRRPLHTGLMLLGVALGVAVVVAIDLANGAAQRGFRRSTDALVGRATHRVVGGPSGLDQALFARLRVEGGLRASAPVVEGVLIADDLGAQPLRVLGVDLLSEGPFRNHLRTATLDSPSVAPFFTEPGAVVLGAALAARHGLRLGSALRARVDARHVTLRVVALIDAQDADEARALDGLLVMDVGQAQRLLRRGARLSRIDLIADEPQLARLRALLPPGVRIEPASQQSRTAAQLTAAFGLNLTALSLLALVVGMFLIYNTVTFSVVERRAVFGTLRLLGATPAQVVALVLCEATLVAALGALLGIALGYALGQGAVLLVTRTINDLYYVLAVREAPLTLASAAKGLLLGVGAGLVAALPPALEAARVEPAQALQASVLAVRARRLVPRVAWAGVALGCCGAAALALWPTSLVASFGGLFGVVLGLALLSPVATLACARLAAPVLRAGLGSLGSLAARGVERHVARTGVAVAALMVAISVTIGVTLMIASFRATVAEWLALALRADLYVGGASAGAETAPSLDPALQARVAALPGVAHVESVRVVEVPSPRGPIQVAVSDATQARDARLYRLAEGTPALAWERVQAGAVLVSEPLHARLRLPAVGASLVLSTDRGERAFAVAGVYYDYATERGTLLMARPVYERFFDDRALTSLAVDVVPGTDAGQVADTLRIALRDTALLVTPNASLRRTALRIFDRTFAVTQALRVLAVVVAFIGVWSALLALQVERTRELATLLALGLAPGQLWRLTMVETGLMGLCAGLLSWPTGALLALILVDVINVRSFGWSMALRFTPGVFAEALAVSVSAALLAAVYPLRRLARLPLASALRRE